MKRSIHNTSERIFFASPWLLATASLLLAFIIGVFAVNNFQREKKLMNMALIQEGRAVLNLISSSSRATLRNMMMHSEFSRERWLASVQEVVEDGADHQGIVSLFLADEEGQVIAHSEKNMVGNKLDSTEVYFLTQMNERNQPHVSRVLGKTSKRAQRFQIAARFNPFGGRNEMLFQMNDGGRGRMMRKMRDQMPGHDTLRSEDKPPPKPLYLIAELDMTGFQKQVGKQFVYIAVLSVVLLLVGVGGLLSLVTIQGFRGSQQKLRSITEFTDVLISSMPLGIIAIEPERIIRTCNDSCQTILGIDGPVVGRSLYDVLPVEVTNTIDELLVTGNDVSQSELTLTTPHRSKNVQIMCVAIVSAQRSDSGYMVLCQDMTKQKNLEREIRRNERHTALGKMAAGVAHELRNPLSSIKGLALLLKSKLDSKPSDLEAAEILISEVERLDRSISELLDYSRPDNPSLTEMQIVQTIRKAITLIRSDAQAEHVKIIEDYEDIQQTVRGDQDKLTQLFLNLFLNSLQAMDDGGTLIIKTRHTDSSVYITLEDSGKGIEEEIREKIFDPYFTTKNEGTGLGLSLSVKIVEDHQGSINLESSQGVGTTVTIVLPA